MTTWIITGRKFSETPHFLSWDDKNRYPQYAETEQVEYKVKAENLDAAEIWLMRNHPDYYMGASIWNGKKGTETAFLFTPVPGLEYREGYFENAANRRKCVAEMLKARLARLTA